MKHVEKLMIFILIYGLWDSIMIENYVLSQKMYGAGIYFPKIEKVMKRLKKYQSDVIGYKHVCSLKSVVEIPTATDATKSLYRSCEMIILHQIPFSSIQS